MEWRKIYESKLVSVEEAAAKIESGDKAWFGSCSSAPIQLLEAIADRVDELENVNLVSGMALYPFKFFQSPKYIGKINYHTVFYGPFERNFFKVGNVKVNSVHLSKLDEVVIDYYKVNTLLADVSLPDEDGYLYYGPMGVSINGVVEEVADKIIVQVNKHQPKVTGIKHRIHVSKVTAICEFDHELPILPQPEVTKVEEEIVSNILPLIPDGATIQVGVGGLANAVAYGLETKKDLSVHTEMFTDSMVHLAKTGVINGKMLAGFGLGSKELYEFIGTGKISLAPISIVNNPYEIGKNDNFISINASLMADLTGQVCSESLGFYQYAGTGGQVDYVRGAALSKGGKSFICMASTVKNKNGQIESTITPVLPQGEVVTTPRADVMYIVTEYGIADLYNKPIEVRVNELIKIAHPDFRDELRKKAIEVGLIRE